MDSAARREWQALVEEGTRLKAEAERLRARASEGTRTPREPFDLAAHEALHAQLAAHSEKLAAWRKRHLRGNANPAAAA